MPKIDPYPRWRDTIHVNTWPSGIERVFALRDFDIRQNDETIGSCVSAWIIIDTDTRRPVRPKSFAHQLNPVEKAHVLDHSLEKLPALAAPQIEKRFDVRYRDLDINQHVNYVSYIEWLLECVPGVGENNRFLSELEVNFLGEALRNDSIRARCRQLDPKNFVHDILQESDKHELVRARTVWLSTGY